MPAMATLEDLSRQIGAAEDLQSVVSTMKAISVAGMRTHEGAERAMTRYLATIEAGLQVVSRAMSDVRPDTAGRSHDLTGVVIVGSEIGLCGAFNERLIEHARQELAASRVARDRRLVLLIGTRAAASWTAEEAPPDLVEDVPATVEALADTVASVITRLDEWRDARGVSRFRLFHQRLRDGAGAAPASIDLWPIDPDWLAALAARPWGSRQLPQCGGPPEVLLRKLIRQLLFARVYTAIIQSRAAEHAERLSAMQAADRSIADKLDDLRIRYRQRRQDVITAELLDLVAGFEAATSGEERDR
jgi:F-type H+-transporting ATPase subunit gamma